MIFGTLEESDDIARAFFVFGIFIFRAVRGGKGIVHDDKIVLSVELYIPGTIHHIKGACDLD